MAKIPCAELIGEFQTMLADGDGYIPGTSGEVWTEAKQARSENASVQKYGSRWIGHRVEDCSGAFVRVYRKYGLSIYHGSNRIAREYVEGLVPMSAARPGMAAFKAKAPGESGYDLPNEYRAGGSHYNGDLNDYYHIGSVDENPKYVINAKGTASGVVRSRASDGWDYAGYLKSVDYIENGGNDDMGILYEAIVDSANDGPVNLRKTPSVNGTLVAKIPDGTVVEVLEETNADWAKIRSGTKTGYMMRGFLVMKPPDDDSANELLLEAIAYMEKAKELTERAMALINI